MAILAKNKGTFEPAPAGPQYAICCDVVDLGMVTSEKFQTITRKIRVCWQSERCSPKTGKPFLITANYSLSLHEKANLRKLLESWQGRPLTDQELEGMDVEHFIDRVAFVNIVHNKTSDGRVFANIAAIMPPPPGGPQMQVHDYTRVKDREGYKPPVIPVGDEPLHGEAQDDDPVPF